LHERTSGIFARFLPSSQVQLTCDCDVVSVQPARELARAHHPTAAAIRHRVGDVTTPPPIVDIVVPVYDEAVGLECSIRRLHAYLRDQLPYCWRITIVDNGSTDGTWFVASRLAQVLDHVRALHLDTKGRGLALRTAWTASDALVVAYMDVDLSTDLAAMLPLIAPIVSGHSDVVIGSRLAPGAAVVRGAKRECISRCYNLLLHLVFRTDVRDAQCGFKAVRSDVARALLPHVVDNAWFFDTELLLLAERNGLRISELAVDWTDDTDSRVKIVRTACDDLRGMRRVAWTFLRRRGRIELGPLARTRSS
jgi:glycosyltransferase involved in cell wall biosynthesis